MSGLASGQLEWIHSVGVLTLLFLPFLIWIWIHNTIIEKKIKKNEEKEKIRQEKLDDIDKEFDRIDKEQIEKEKNEKAREDEKDIIEFEKWKWAKETNKNMAEWVADGLITAKEYKEWRMDNRAYFLIEQKIDEPHIVYYVKVDNGSLGCLYKIGITKHDVHTRFSSSERDVMTVIKEWKFDSRMEAKLYEDGVLKRFSDHKYQGPNVLDSGNTELFTRDVMGLDLAA